MTKSSAILPGSLALSCLAIAFCIWSALGNDVNICVTTGCMLYQDFTIAKISLWWIGATAFACLGGCAILGQAAIGRWLAAVFLAGDVCLLFLMALTAPCVSCLAVAIFFALIYLSFRKQNTGAKQHAVQRGQKRFSILLAVWLALFIVNLGQVARSQIGIWPILDESGEASTRMFFSPSCKYCIEGVNALSGNIAVAFYPLAESDADVAKVAKMMALLADGMGLAEAMGQSQQEEFTNFWQQMSPNMLLLRFRMLRNKAHLFAQGSQGVPFFERKGLPSGMQVKPDKRQIAPAQTSVSNGDYTLPPELTDSTQCVGKIPCPPAQ